MQETQVQSLGQQDPLEEKMPTHCSILAWKNPMDKGAWWATVHGVHSSSWIFIGRTDAEAETPILWPPDGKNWLTGKDPDAGKAWRQEKKGMTEDEMAGWHQRLDGHELEQALGVADGQGGLACCSPWSHKKSDTTKRLNWTGHNWAHT